MWTPRMTPVATRMPNHWMGTGPRWIVLSASVKYGSRSTAFGVAQNRMIRCLLRVEIVASASDCQGDRRVRAARGDDAARNRADDGARPGGDVHPRPRGQPRRVRAPPP